MDNLTLIIPTFNEEGNIKELLDKLIITYPNIPIIIADDGSTDKTQEIVKSYKNNIQLLDRTHKPIHGLSESVMDASLNTKTENIIVMDADFQHPIKKIKEINQKLKTNDLVIARRKTIPKNWPLSRKLISKTAGLLAKIRLKKNIQDPMSGFFGIKSNILQNLSNNYYRKIDGRGYKILFDTLKYSKKPKIDYVEYDFALRKAGESKISKKHIFYFLKSLFK